MDERHADHGERRATWLGLRLDPDPNPNPKPKPKPKPNLPAAALSSSHAGPTTGMARVRAQRIFLDCGLGLG